MIGRVTRSRVFVFAREGCVNVCGNAGSGHLDVAVPCSLCSLCSVACRAIDVLYSWLFSIMVVNKNSLNYCSSSDKSKRRTKTVKKSLEPKWNQTFMYSPVHRREFRERMLEITLWDQARVREEESEFLGEVRKSQTAAYALERGSRP